MPETIGSKRESGMVAYEFYIRDEQRGDRLLGILPERRKDRERVNPDTIINWAKVVFSKTVDVKRVFFVRIILENNGEDYHSRPISESR